MWAVGRGMSTGLGVMVVNKPWRRSRVWVGPVKRQHRKIPWRHSKTESQQESKPQHERG